LGCLLIPVFLLLVPGPTIERISPPVGPVYGRAGILILGRWFGNSGSLFPKTTIGGRPCLAFEFFNASALRCVTPPARGEQTVDVVTGKWKSNFRGDSGTGRESTYRYSKPIISSAVPSSFPMTGNIKAEIRGLYLGDSANTPRITIDGADCLQITVVR
jgi:hypothetical protein